jgi:hypothetical protein
VIPRDREINPRKNKKAKSYPRVSEKNLRKNKKAWGVGFNHQVCRFQICRF